MRTKEEVLEKIRVCNQSIQNIKNDPRISSIDKGYLINSDVKERRLLYWFLQEP